MAQGFLQTWHTAAMTTLGLFWMAFWAFALGYMISSMIQVFLTRERMRQSMGWRMVARRYVMEWRMVWKDVSVGFTVAGIIAAFVPPSFLQALFIGVGDPYPPFWAVLEQTLISPFAAFLTFIGSMGNIPLAAVLYGNGVSFAGIMAFIFSDLVVLPVLRIQTSYYGWRMALDILGVFLVVLVASALLLHYGFALFGFLPDPSAVRSVTDRQFFAVDYTLFLNLAFAAMTVLFLAWKTKTSGFDTARTAGYLMEGHVPAADIAHLLDERRETNGPAVPAMPVIAGTWR